MGEVNLCCYWVMYYWKIWIGFLCERWYRELGVRMRGVFVFLVFLGFMCFWELDVIFNIFLVF